MKVSISAGRLLSALKEETAVIANTKKIPFDFLKYALIRTGEEEVNITATNLECWVTVTAKADVQQEGLCLIPVSQTLKLLRQTDPDTEVQISHTEEEEEEKTLFRCKDFSASFITPPASDFPEEEEKAEEEPVWIEASPFREAILRVFHAAEKKPDSSFPAGIHITHQDEKLLVVATDSRRLAIYERKFEHLPENLKLTIPISAAKTLVNVLKEQELAGLSVTNEWFTVTSDSVRLNIRPLERPFPDFNRIIKSVKFSSVITASYTEFLEAVKCMLIAADPSLRALKITFLRNKAVLSAAAEDGSIEGMTELPIKTEGNTKKTEIWLNARFLLEALQSAGQAEIHFQDSETPLCVIGENYREYIAPMREPV